MHSSSPPFMLHALTILLDFIILIILGKEYNLWSSLLIFSSLPSVHLSLAQIFSSAPCSQTSSVYVPSIMSKSHTLTEPKTKLSYLYSDLYIFMCLRFHVEWVPCHHGLFVIVTICYKMLHKVFILFDVFLFPVSRVKTAMTQFSDAWWSLW
jgi:hypothetical protein